MLKDLIKLYVKTCFGSVIYIDVFENVEIDYASDTNAIYEYAHSQLCLEYGENNIFVFFDTLDEDVFDNHFEFLQFVYSKETLNQIQSLIEKELIKNK